MLAFAVSIFAILSFVLALTYLDIPAISRDAIRKAQSGALAILDRKLSDTDKEAAVRSAGLALLKATFAIAWRILACLLAGALPVYVLSYAGLASTQQVFGLMLRWDYIVGTSLGFCLIAWAVFHAGDKKSGAHRYSGADQILHRLAFSSPRMQLTASEIEDRLFARRLELACTQPPVFITSLPRAGTTILLSALNEIPGTSTHRYRDMPFVLAPLLWSRLSTAFAKQEDLIERAHGDGIKVGYDSPEAFEEVIWRVFWPEKYHPDFIELWGRKDAKPEATAFFTRHCRKLVALRAAGTGRYISKNNNNIARLDLLQAMFEGAQVVVPLREPAEHCASMLRQHHNFAAQHAADPFAERYMQDIGHLEFGALHTPIAFPMFDPKSGCPYEADYWLDYWIAAYSEILLRASQLHLVSQEKLGRNPAKVLYALCERLQLVPDGNSFARHIHPIPDRCERGLFGAAKLTRATEIYLALRAYEI